MKASIRDLYLLWVGGAIGHIAFHLLGIWTRPMSESAVMSFGGLSLIVMYQFFVCIGIFKKV